MWQIRAETLDITGIPLFSRSSTTEIYVYSKQMQDQNKSV